MYMKRTQLYLDETERKALEAASKKSGKSIGQLVREAVDEVYCRHASEEKPLSEGDPIWSFIGQGRSAETDAAERHDEHLYRKGE
jgi:hypothetical protein